MHGLSRVVAVVVVLTSGVVGGLGVPGAGAELGEARIAFSTNVAEGEDFDLWSVRDDGTDLRRLTSSDLAEGGPVWSPDATRIAFLEADLASTYRALVVMNADGSGRHVVATTHAMDYVWSPDGRQIAFEAGSGDYCNDYPYCKEVVRNTPHVFLANADGSGYARLADGVDPTWSPDGTRLAFSAVRRRAEDGLQQYSISVIGRDGTGIAPLTTGDDDFRPRWSPRGDAIAFDRDRNHAMVIAPDGSALREVFTGTGVNGVAFLTWSPSGDRLALTPHFGMDDWNLWTVRPDGSDKRRLTAHDTFLHWPSWSADGTRIAYSLDERRLDGKPQADIHIVAADGSTDTTITDLDRVFDPEWGRPRALTAAPAGATALPGPRLDATTPVGVGAVFHGSTGDRVLNKPIVGMAATPSGDGYWLVASDGGLFSFGDARFHGSTGDRVLNKPIVGMAATPTGDGYWLVASDGGLFAFGDARFHGSTGDRVLNKPIVGMATTPSGDGYWLVASDGGLFSFGDARFHGSTGDRALNKPIVSMATTPTGDGYWLTASDGGIFAFGDARFHGSTGDRVLNKPIVGMAAPSVGDGYWLVASDGGIFALSSSSG